MPPVLADSHVHLDRYSPAQVESMLETARRAGVCYFLAVGVDAVSSAAAVDLARRHAGVVAAVGVHPKRVDAASRLANVGAQFIAPLTHQARAGDVGNRLSAIDVLSDLAQQPGVVAIGEVGLDDTSAAPLADQQRFLGACLVLAQELDPALSLHVVGAHRQAQKMLASRGPLRSVVHYFQGDWPLAESYLALGCHISVGKPVTRSENAALREAVCRIPLDRLLLETDTYPLPGRTTEPRDVVQVCQAVAEIKSLPFEAVAKATTANFRRLFMP